jgi:rhamnulokinase
VTALAAIDLGAQSGRVVLGRLSEGRLQVNEVRRFPNRPVRTGERLQWDILRLYADAIEGVAAAAGVSEEPLAAIGVDSWGVDFGLLDAHGRLLQNPVHYRDPRRAAAYEPTLAQIPARDLYQRTGIQLMPINSIFELAAMAAEHDPVLEAAETLLLIPDLVAHWLCGSRVSEYTNATTTQLRNAGGEGWAVDLLEELEIPGRLLPDVVLPGTPLGRLRAQVAAEVGGRETQVVAVATHDTASAVAAVPFRRPGSVFVSAGTWSLVGLEVDRPLINDATFAANLTNEGGVSGTTRLLRNINGLGLMHACRSFWARTGRSYGFDELVALAGQAPALRSLFDPDDPRLVGADDVPERIREVCIDTRQPVPEEPAAVVRCLLESLALKHARVIEALSAATGVAPEEVHVVGGGARNELLCRWTAEAVGLPLLAGPEEATAVGNLLVQALALGEIASLAEARDVVRSSFRPAVFDPVSSAGWDEARERFADLVGAPPALERRL